jgi:uncharacterized RDD family membrane protein YckC
LLKLFDKHRVLPPGGDNVLENHVQVRTPEQVKLRLPLAGIGSRAVAQLVDLTVLALVYAIFAVSEVLWRWLDVFGRATSYLVGATVLISFLIFWGYFIALETSLSGQSLGKRLMKIRVVQRDGRPVTFYSATVRNLLRIVDFLPLGYLVGLIVAVIDSQERRLGDLVAGTVVVKDKLPSFADYIGFTLTPEADQNHQEAKDGAGEKRRIIKAARCDVIIELLDSLPGEWTQFLLGFGPRLKGLSKQRREELLQGVWSRFTELDEVSLVWSAKTDGSLRLDQIERLLQAVSKQLRVTRRGRKL